MSKLGDFSNIAANVGRIDRPVVVRDGNVKDLGIFGRIVKYLRQIGNQRQLRNSNNKQVISQFKETISSSASLGQKHAFKINEQLDALYWTLERQHKSLSARHVSNILSPAMKSAHKWTKISKYTKKYDFDKHIPLSNLDDRTFEDPRGPIYLFSKCIDRDISWANKYLVAEGKYQSHLLPGGTILPDDVLFCNPLYFRYIHYSPRKKMNQAQGIDIFTYDGLNAQQLEILGQKEFGLNVDELKLNNEAHGQEEFRRYVEVYNRIVVETCLRTSRNRKLSDADKANILLEKYWNILCFLSLRPFQVDKMLGYIEQTSELMQAMHDDFENNDPESFLKNMTKLYCVNNGLVKYMPRQGFKMFSSEELISIALRVGFTRVDANFGKVGLERLTTWLKPFSNIISSEFMTEEALADEEIFGAYQHIPGSMEMMDYLRHNEMEHAMRFVSDKFAGKIDNAIDLKKNWKSVIQDGINEYMQSELDARQKGSSAFSKGIFGFLRKRTGRLS